MFSSRNEKLALALAFMSLFGNDVSAMSTSKNDVKSSQTLGAASVDNSKTLKKSKSMTNLKSGNLKLEDSTSKVLVKSKSMSNLTKAVIGVGAGAVVLGGYEILADTVIDKAPSIWKLFSGKKNMSPDEIKALIGEICDRLIEFKAAADEVRGSMTSKYVKSNEEVNQEIKKAELDYDDIDDEDAEAQVIICKHLYSKSLYKKNNNIGNALSRITVKNYDGLTEINSEVNEGIAAVMGLMMLSDSIKSFIVLKKSMKVDKGFKLEYSKNGISVLNEEKNVKQVYEFDSCKDLTLTSYINGKLMFKIELKKNIE